MSHLSEIVNMLLSFKHAAVPVWNEQLEELLYVEDGHHCV